MRQFKFRAWHTDEFPVVDMRNTMLPHEQLLIDGCIDGHNAGNIVLMQYTGIDDMIGQPIYEGDIVDFASDFNRQVIWGDGGFVCITKGMGDWTNLHKGSSRELLVIGNVYEHPEKLK